jgi:cell division protein FtsI/penicillin-binding protein 2
MAGRIKFLMIVFVLAYGVALWRLYDLQILNNQKYFASAKSQYLNKFSNQAFRGNIYFKDKDNNLIIAATNQNFPIIYAVPKEIEDAEEVVSELSSIINIKDKDSLIKRLKNPKSEYALILRKADKEIVQKIKAMNIKGIYIDQIPERFYPFNLLASHILGYVGYKETESSSVGLYGLEKLYNDFLNGFTPDFKNGEVVLKNGNDLILTIDPNIQIEAERILSSLIQEQKAKGGVVIVEDPQTGKILAMSGMPNFDPNNYSKYNVSDFLNPAVSKIYEPGSILKVITMSAGIDSKKVTQDTTFIDSGSITLNNKTIRNWDLKAYGKTTMTEVIERSINTGAVFVQRQMGRDIFLNYLKRFGFDKKTQIDLPDEVSGSLKSLSLDAPDINFATAAFGQGIAVTPIELINAISVIANGGKLMKPYLNAQSKPEVLLDNVISKETATQVTKMMKSAVDKAQVAKIKGYSIAGKTGTAQVPDLKKGGYKEAYIHTYVGFAPTTNPKFIILIRIDEPQKAQLAGLTVVPAFREIAQFILNYYNIPPDEIINE